MPGSILLVEDHPTMRDAVRAILEGDGHRVTEATDGLAALDRIRDGRFDLVLLDLNLPGLSGHELLAAIRGEPAGAELPVIVVTATGEEGRADALGAGADDYVTKPFGPAALLEKVARLLAAPGAPGA
jgi:CheY-like chemotaxis protein